MAADLRGHTMFPSTGFNAPTRFEADIYDCNAYPPYAFDIRRTTAPHMPLTAGVADAVGTADQSLSGPVLRFIQSLPP